MTCKGKILESVKVDPVRAYFGRVSRTSPPVTKTVTLKRGDGAPVHLKLRPIDKEGIEAKLRELKAGEHYELDITVGTPLKSNRLSVRLELDTGIPETPIAYVPVFAVATPRVTANPRRVVVPPSRPDDWEQKVILRWDDGAPPKITKLSIDTPLLEVRYDEDSSAPSVQTLVVKALNAKELPPGIYTLLIETDDDVKPELRVSITARLPRASRKSDSKGSASMAPGSKKKMIRASKTAATPGSPVRKAGKPVAKPVSAIDKAKTAQP